MFKKYKNYHCKYDNDLKYFTEEYFTLSKKQIKILETLMETNPQKFEVSEVRIYLFKKYSGPFVEYIFTNGNTLKFSIEVKLVTKILFDLFPWEIKWYVGVHKNTVNCYCNVFCYTTERIIDRETCVSQDLFNYYSLKHDCIEFVEVDKVFTREKIYNFLNDFYCIKSKFFRDILLKNYPYEY